MSEDRSDFRNDFQRAARVVGAGWLGTYLGMEISGYPVQFLLKDELKLTASSLALFGLIGNVSGYLKPLTGILVDTFPLCGTQRRHYLLLGLLASGALFFALGLVPRTFGWLLGTYVLLFVCLNLVSTVLGGLMVDVGHLHGATGRMSAQRVGIGRFSALVTGPAGARLAQFPFLRAMLISGGLHLALIPLVYCAVREPRTAHARLGVLEETAQSLRTLARSRALWTAAGLVMLVVMAPGFGTPLFFYQTDVLRFSKDFLGLLSFVNALFSMVGAALYAGVCRRFALRQLLIWSIIIHAGGTLFYLGYRSPASALGITALEGVAQTLAVLPLYDLAARAAPKGLLALGYALMMSAWNVTAATSNLVGSWLSDSFGLTFMQLVWLNAGTTAAVLFVVPFLPVALMNRAEGKQ